MSWCAFFGCVSDREAIESWADLAPQSLSTWECDLLEGKANDGLMQVRGSADDLRAEQVETGRRV